MSEVTSYSVTVQWREVDCIHHNGNITSYSVKYWVLGSWNTQNMSVSGDEANISNLMSSTIYYFQVAAVNNAGIGVYSYPLATFTHGNFVHLYKHEA